VLDSNKAIAECYQSNASMRLLDLLAYIPFIMKFIHSQLVYNELVVEEEVGSKPIYILSTPFPRWKRYKHKKGLFTLTEPTSNLLNNVVWEKTIDY